MKKSFKEIIAYFTPFERVLWLCSVTLITLSSCLGKDFYPLSLIASLLGVTSLIFIAKGNFVGQIMIMIFSILYGIISIRARYYGEMITYLFMSLPAAVFACISWLKNPSKQGKHEVQIGKLSLQKWLICVGLSIVATIVLYFVLRYFNANNLIVSTISVTTSMLAASLLFFRSPFYALAYVANDLVLIVLWVTASVHDLSYLPTVVCFTTFLFNDTYSFVNWTRMQKRQARDETLS
ncbi:MAG: nicotinamide mononucleotide transporter [Clostridia bacterium]|nr:nicotinamide mononucleotide transporter [Clostridia bacterium]